MSRASDFLLIDDKAWSKSMKDLAEKALPRALADTVNSMAFEARKSMPDAMKKGLDRPTPFSLRAWQVGKAKPSKGLDTIEATFFARDIQGEYLSYILFGGERHAGDPGATKYDVPLPADKKSRFGGVPRGLLKKLSAQNQEEKRYRASGRSAFIEGGIWFGSHAGLLGYWQRPKRKKLVGPKQKGVRRWANIGEPKILFRFREVTKHKPVFRADYDATVQAAHGFGVKKFASEMDRQLKKMKR